MAVKFGLFGKLFMKIWYNLMKHGGYGVRSYERFFVTRSI